MPGHNEGKCISSQSYINDPSNIGGHSLTPDNYLVTPKLSVLYGATLSFWVSAQDAEWAAEHYTVYASSTGNTAADFTATAPLIEETLSAKNRFTLSNSAIRGSRAQGTWYEKSVIIPPGTKYVAFRHFNSSDQFMITLDDVIIYAEAMPKPIELSYNIYRDGEFIKNVSTTSFEEELPNSSTLIYYEVEVQYPNGVSPKASVSLTIPGGGGEQSGKSLIVLEANNVWSDGTGYQMFLDNTATAFGDAIPTSGPLVTGCDVPEGLLDKFSHKLPETAVISCQPNDDQWVVDGEARLVVDAGTYDYCISNPQPGVNIWIAGGEQGRYDNFQIEPNKYYEFKAYLDGIHDAISVTVGEWNSIEEIVSAMHIYGTEGFVVIEADKAAQISVFDLKGRRIASQLVEGKAMIPADAGIYLVQVQAQGKSHATKVIVK